MTKEEFFVTSASSKTTKRSRPKEIYTVFSTGGVSRVFSPNRKNAKIKLRQMNSVLIKQQMHLQNSIMF